MISANLVGNRFGLLTVVERAGSNPRGRALWLCLCDCGITITVHTTALKRATTKSCGCWRRERMIQRNTTHGGRYTPEYHTWRGMIERCTQPGINGYENYGGRGIAVCEHWRKFERFLADVGLRPSPDHTLGRIDVNRNYEPGNAHWETQEEQANNRRNSRFLTYRKRTLTITQWARLLQCGADTLSKRFDAGWPIHRILKTPVRVKNRLWTWNGKTQSLTAWARDLDINRGSLAERIANGWSMKRTFETKGLGRIPKSNSRAELVFKMHARRIVARALGSGKLVKQPCYYCGARSVEAHHTDYSRPLEVVWICSLHHHQLHIYGGRVPGGSEE
jgi:hypothetical protein